MVAAVAFTAPMSATLSPVASSAAPFSDLLACNTSSNWFPMPTSQICGDWDCNPGAGVPNANLSAALKKVALDIGPDCEGCPQEPQVGCERAATVDPGDGVTISNEAKQDPDAGCPSGWIYRRCITMPEGEAFITCGSCDLGRNF